MDDFVLCVLIGVFCTCFFMWVYMNQVFSFIDRVVFYFTGFVLLVGPAVGRWVFGGFIDG